MLQTVKRTVLIDFAFWLLVYLALWTLLSGASGWLFGAVCAAAASWVSMALALKPPRLRWRVLPGLLGFFLWKTAIGGWDVARRVLDPRLPVDPGWEEYRLTSTHPDLPLLLSALVGLMPGTLTANIVGNQLHLHLLDRRLPWRESMFQLERQLDRLLGGCL